MYRYTHCRISILNFWLWVIYTSAYVSEIFIFVLVAKTLGHCFSYKTGKSIEMPAAKYEFHPQWYHWNGNAQEHALGLEPLQGIEPDSLRAQTLPCPSSEAWWKPSSQFMCTYYRDTNVMSHKRWIACQLTCRLIRMMATISIILRTPDIEERTTTTIRLTL